MRLNDRVEPAARGAVSDIGLFFVGFFHFRAQLFELFRRRFLVAPLAGTRQNRKDGIGSLGRAHHGIARIRPGENETRIISLAAERIVARAKRTADHDRDFRHDRIADRIDQLRAAPNDAALFRVAPDHEAGYVLEKNDRQSGLIAIHDEPRGFVGAVGINDAAHLDARFFRAHLMALIGDDPDRMAADPRIGGDERLAVVGLVFIERIRVDDRGEQIARIVLLLAFEADQVVNRVWISSPARVAFLLAPFFFAASASGKCATSERSRFRQAASSFS